MINPQNGHIICSRTSWTRGLIIRKSFLRESQADARRLRADGRNGSIDFTFYESFLLILTHMDRRFCAGLLTVTSGPEAAGIGFYDGSEQFRSAIGCSLGDHGSSAESCFSLFQVL